MTGGGPLEEGLSTSGSQHPDPYMHEDPYVVGSCLPVCLSIRLSVCLFGGLSACLCCMPACSLASVPVGPASLSPSRINMTVKGNSEECHAQAMVQ